MFLPHIWMFVLHLIPGAEYEIKKPEEYCLTLPICLNRYSGVSVSSIHSFTENAHCKRA